MERVLHQIRMALPELPWYPLALVCSGEAKSLITIDVECESLKDLVHIKNAIATPMPEPSPDY